MTTPPNQHFETSFQAEYSEKQNCGCTKRETINYELQIKVQTVAKFNGTRVNQWRAYWEPRNYGSFYKSPSKIGNYFDGEETLEEAMKKAFKARDLFLNEKK